MNLNELSDKELLDYKKEIENKIAKYDISQYSKKVKCNSCYGAIGSEWFRFYSKPLGEAVTSSGQLAIRWAHNRLNNYLNQILGTEKQDYIIAVDTDSLYVNFDELISKIQFQDSQKETIINWLDKISEEKIQPFLDKCYEELAMYTNAFQQKMFIKREAIAETAFWVAKKRYALAVIDNEGVRYNEPDIKVSGLEAVRSSTPEIVRDAFKKLYKILLLGTEEELQNFNKEFKEIFFSSPAEDIGMPSGVQGLKKYKESDGLTWKKGAPAGVKSVYTYNELLRKLNLLEKYDTIKEGEKIRKVQLIMPNPAGQSLIAISDGLPEEFNLEKFIDYETQFYKTYEKPLEHICEFIGWKMEQSFSLEDWL